MRVDKAEKITQSLQAHAKKFGLNPGDDGETVE